MFGERTPFWSRRASDLVLSYRDALSNALGLPTNATITRSSLSKMRPPDCLGAIVERSPHGVLDESRRWETQSGSVRLSGID